mmetsp:Transcript_103777/g.203515  ORF Transcript_103777/g.203515 Transcript_103777/m.203515 type:complete len:107 (-) Transcript_103777:229-549(-)
MIRLYGIYYCATPNCLLLPLSFPSSVEYMVCSPRLRCFLYVLPVSPQSLCVPSDPLPSAAPLRLCVLTMCCSFFVFCVSLVVCVVSSASTQCPMYIANLKFVYCNE